MQVSKTISPHLHAAFAVVAQVTLASLVGCWQRGQAYSAKRCPGNRRELHEEQAHPIAFPEYKLSTRSLVYLEADNTRWKRDYQGAGRIATSTGVSLGIKHSF